MDMGRSNRIITSLWIACSLAACGGAQSKVEEPNSESAAAPEKPPAEPAETASAADAPKDKPSEAKAEEPAKEEPQKSIRSAKDILTREGVFFELSFADSDAHEAASKRCSEKAGNDPKKKADCMTKASEEIDANGIAFRHDETGKWFWLTIRRSGPKMVPLHKFEVEFEGDGDKSVALAPKGKDQGTKPMRAPDKVTVEVPSESQIVLTDPKLGKLVYVAKMGLFGKDDR